MKKTIYLFFATIIFVAIIITSLKRSDIPVEELKKEFTTKQSKFIRIDGMDVHYTDDGEGIPLVLIHGISSSLNTWDGWNASLQNDFRIIRLDLPGFGLTGPNPKNDYSIDFYVAFMQTFLKALEVDSCFMAGSSLGGYITWNLASSQPDLIRKMILIDAAGYPFVPEETPIFFKVAQSPFAPYFKSFTPKFLVGQVINEVYGNDSKVTDEVVNRNYLYALREGNREAFLSLVSKIEFKEFTKLKAINTPTLIMWGEKDNWVSPKLAKRFNSDLPNSQLIMYPGVGHIPMEEIPEQTAEDARNYFLDDATESVKKLN